MKLNVYSQETHLYTAHKKRRDGVQVNQHEIHPQYEGEDLPVDHCHSGLLQSILSDDQVSLHIQWVGGNNQMSKQWRV